jgi:hypothetical protein
MGVRLALDPGRGRSAVPVRATLAAVAVGVASMAAAVTFSASLGHLFAAPALYGTTFDAHVTAADNAGGDLGPSVESMRNDPAVDAVFVGWDSLFMRSGRVNFGTQAGMTAKGSFHPTVLAGRSPDAPNEILLGSRTMRDLHAHIGATVPVEIAGLTRPIPMRVVGRGVLPAMADTEQLGTGAVVAPSALRAFAAKGPPGLSVPPPTDLFVRLRRGVATTTGLAELQNRLGGPALVVVAPAKQPTDISNFGQVRDLPQLLAGLLAALAVGTMVYLLVTAARRRRHDLAVLKVLGLDPRQVSAVMMWSATTITALALLVGLPAGVAAGRWMWMYVADQLGVVPRPTVPVLLALLFVPVAVVLGNVVAALPARAAARIPAADVLRRD